jgi:hypothetical protein
MLVSEIEKQPEVVEAALILAELEANGLVEPAIASGWTRSLLTDTTTPDIDVSYVGSVHFESAQTILENALKRIRPSNYSMWDVKGIWNAESAYGVTHTVDNLLLYYVDSIDSVYLAADGKLHDPTGQGFDDAKAKTLRINMYDIERGGVTDSEEINVCLEACRRIVKLGWNPTYESSQRIKSGVVRWSDLSEDKKQYFTGKLAKKYLRDEVMTAQDIYEGFGWGFIFEEADFLARLR